MQELEKLGKINGGAGSEICELYMSSLRRRG